MKYQKKVYSLLKANSSFSEVSNESSVKQKLEILLIHYLNNTIIEYVFPISTYIHLSFKFTVVQMNCILF